MCARASCDEGRGGHTPGTLHTHTHTRARAGLLFRLRDEAAGAAASEPLEWPDLVGKVTASGKLLPAPSPGGVGGTSGAGRVFKALQRIAADESRLLQVRECVCSRRLG